MRKIKEVADLRFRDLQLPAVVLTPSLRMCEESLIKARLMDVIIERGTKRIGENKETMLGK